MSSETKTLLTEEYVKRDLLAQNDLSLCVFLTVLSLFAFFLPLILGLAALRLSKVLGVLLLAAAAAMLCLGVYTVASILRKEKRRQRLVKEGRFSIVTDQVAYTVKGERKHTYPNNFWTTEDVIYFKTHGRYLPTKTIFDFAAGGDVFYLVILEDEPPHIALAYHAKIYRMR